MPKHGLILGMPSLVEHDTFEDDFALCRACELDFIELNCNLPRYTPGLMDASGAAGRIRSSGVYITLHADENLNPFDFNPTVREMYRQVFAQTADLAVSLGARIINMHLHPGVYFSLPDRKVYLFEKYLSEYMRSVEEFMALCREVLPGDGSVAVLIENAGVYQPFRRQAIELMLTSPLFGLTYDIGHEHGAGNRNLDFLLSHADRLRHMHFHDGNAGGNHLNLGEGEIDIAAKLELARKWGCSCVLETKTAQAVRASLDYIEQLYKKAT